MQGMGHRSSGPRATQLDAGTTGWWREVINHDEPEVAAKSS
jgi:hypothetical protein